MPDHKLLVETACSRLHVKRRLADIGETVRVNMNLNRGLISVKGASGPDRGKVLFHTGAPVCLEDAEFRVRDAVYQKIQESGARDVCAYVQGTLRPYHMEGDSDEARAVSYNPHRQKHFHLEDGTAVGSADVLRAWVDQAGEGKAKGRMEGIGLSPIEKAQSSS